MVVVFPARAGGLVADDALAGVQALDEPQLVEHLERPVDRGDPNLAAALAEAVGDLLGAQAAVLLGEQVHHGLARGAGAVAGTLERL